MIYELLEKLNIKYEEVEHEAVFTADDAQFIKSLIKGVGCKNLFLKDELGNFYLYVLADDSKADLKGLEKFLNIKKIHFGGELELREHLNVWKGSVTPLAIINDKNNLVKVVIDKRLVGKKLLVHPDCNTKTLAINYLDLVKYVKYLQHEYLIF